jgi:hypothetical protein
MLLQQCLLEKLQFVQDGRYFVQRAAWLVHGQHT